MTRYKTLLSYTCPLKVMTGNGFLVVIIIIIIILTIIIIIIMMMMMIIIVIIIIIIIIILILLLLLLLLIIIIIMIMKMIIIIIAFKGSNRDFLQSPHCAENCCQHVHSSGQGAIVCKSRATHRALFTCNMQCAN